MPFVAIVAKEDARGPVKHIYETSIASYGRIANIVKLLSLDGQVMQSSMALYVNLMKRENALSPGQREMIATVVSHNNDCYYCTLSHAEDFRAESGYDRADEIADQLIYDYRLAMLSDADRALCDYAVKLTSKSAEVSQYDIEYLRQYGFEDPAISLAAQVVAFFNYINRIASGLGVDPEPDMTPSEETWRSLKASLVTA